MTRRLGLLAAPTLMFVAAACGPVGPTSVPTMSSDDLVACQGIPAPRPTPPDFGPDDAYLDRIIGPLSAEVMAKTPEFSYIYPNGITHIIVIGALHPTKAMCDDLHARYGPWIRVEQGGPIVPTGAASSGRA